MQKVIYFNDIKQINAELENGWEIAEVYEEKGMALIEKNEQQCIYHNPGSDTNQNKLKALIDSGWKIRQMEPCTGTDGFGCYLWIEK